MRKIKRFTWSDMITVEIVLLMLIIIGSAVAAIQRYGFDAKEIDEICESVFFYSFFIFGFLNVFLLSFLGQMVIDSTYISRANIPSKYDDNYISSSVIKNGFDASDDSISIVILAAVWNKSLNIKFLLKTIGKYAHMWERGIDISYRDDYLYTKLYEVAYINNSSEEVKNFRNMLRQELLNRGYMMTEEAAKTEDVEKLNEHDKSLEKYLIMLFVILLTGCIVNKDYGTVKIIIVLMVLWGFYFFVPREEYLFTRAANIKKMELMKYIDKNI